MATIKSIKEKATRYDKALGRAKKLYEQGTITESLSYVFPELKESEDERIRKELVQFFKEKDEEDFEEWIPKAKVLDWLEKKGEQKPQGKTVLEAIKEEKVDNANKVEPQDEFTKFEKAVKQVLEEAIECGDTHNLKADADMLLSLAHKSAWSEEDETGLSDALWAIQQAKAITKDENDMGNLWYAENWIKSLKNRVQPQPKQEWSKEGKRKMYRIYSILGQAADAHAFSTTCRLIGDKECIELQDFLKSLRPQSTWKPSDEQIKQLGWIAEQNKNNMIGKELITLYQDLKKLREE